MFFGLFLRKNYKTALWGIGGVQKRRFRGILGAKKPIKTGGGGCKNLTPSENTPEKALLGRFSAAGAAPPPAPTGRRGDQYATESAGGFEILKKRAIVTSVLDLCDFAGLPLR